MLTQWWEYWLQTLNGHNITKLKALDGSLHASTEDKIPWSGRITLIVDSQLDGVNWWKTRVAPVYCDSDGARIQVGSFHARKGKLVHEPGRDLLELNLYDPVIHVDEDRLPAFYTIPAGTNIASTVRALVKSVGVAGVYGANPEVTRRNNTWAWGSSKLEVVNELLASGGFYPLHSDSLGRLRVQVVADPLKARVKYWFARSSEAVHSPQWEATFGQDLPNRITVRAPGDAGKPDLITSVVDNNDFAVSGVWRTEVVDGLEASSISALRLQANRLMAKRRRDTGLIYRQCAFQNLRLWDVVGDVDGNRFQVESIDIEFTAGLSMKLGLLPI